MDVSFSTKGFHTAMSHGKSLHTHILSNKLISVCFCYCCWVHPYSYGALFGPQLFGHGTRVESHKSFGKIENKPNALYGGNSR